MYARLDLIKGSLCIAKSSGAVLSLRMKNYLKKIYLFNIFMQFFFLVVLGFLIVLFGIFFQKDIKSMGPSSLSLKRRTELDSLLHGGTIHFFSQNQCSKANSNGKLKKKGLKTLEIDRKSLGILEKNTCTSNNISASQHFL